MRQRGLSPAGCNIYIRAMNAFCSWLKDEGHTFSTIKLRQLKAHPKPVKVFSETDLRLFLAHKPKRMVHQRTWVVIALGLDTGCRIDELLSLERQNVDFDNLLMTVNGKGGKQRKVPFSYVLQNYLM